jgi:uncharacterized protein (TIGR03663 family)
MNRAVAIFLLLAAALALGLRCPHLDSRPMHNDEGVNALKFGQLWEGAGYRYDPEEHHGPTLIYGSAWLGRLTGAPDYDHYSEARLRLLDVLFGVGLIVLLPWVMDGLGRRATLWAAFLTAVSPAMVFYSRYYIHEMLLVFFTLLALAAGWRYWRSRRIGWALLAGVALGLMHATKETFVLTLAAAAAALALNLAWSRWLDASTAAKPSRPLKIGPLAAGAVLWLAVAALFFSSFLTNPQGLLDSLRTYEPWIHRAGGASPHIHPWSFYFQRLFWFHSGRGPVWTELLILLLALVGIVSAFRRSSLGRGHAGFVRFVALYTLVLAAIYSVISYKTPWCLLSFWHGAILLAGVGGAVLMRLCRTRSRRLALSCALLAGIAHLAWQGWLMTGDYAADRRNPYVYAQTSPDVLELVDRVESLQQAMPAGAPLQIQVAAPEGDYGPLPWYLRRFKRIGWWSGLPSESGQVLILATSLKPGPGETRGYPMAGYFNLRPQVPFELYVEPTLWRDFLNGRAAAGER